MRLVTHLVRSFLSLHASKDSTPPLRSSALRRRRHRARLAVELLEPRRVLAGASSGFTSIGLDSLATGNLTIEDTTAGGKSDRLTLRRVGADVLVTDPDATLVAGLGATSIDAHSVSVPLAAIVGRIHVTLGGAADSLTIDLSAGDPIPNGNLSYDGGGPTTSPGDQLTIVGGNQGIVTYAYASPNSGSVAMSNFGTISYSGLEPILNTGSADQIVLQLPNGGNVATLTDDGTLGNGIVRLTSSPTTFERTDFRVPNGSLSILGGTGADQLTLTALGDLNATLTIDGAAGSDSVVVAGPLVLGSSTSAGSFAATAETISLGASISTDAGSTSSAGNVTLTGGTIDLSANVTIDVDRASGLDGAITFNNGLNADSAANNRTLTLVAGTGAVVAQNLGATRNLQAFSIVSAGVASLQSVRTRSGGIQVTATTLALNGNLTSDALSTAGPISLTGAMTLNANLTIDADAATNDGAVTLGAGSSVDGPFSLTITSGSANTSLTTTNLGAVVPLTTLSVTAAEVTSSGTIGTATGVTINSSGATSSFSGLMRGSGGFAKQGTGTLTLSGTAPNTFSGPISVAAGSLFVNKSHLGAGAVTVANGATLGGTGSVGGAVTLASSARLVPGPGVETFATGNLALATGATLSLDLGEPQPGNGMTGYDQIQVVGSVDLTGANLQLNALAEFQAHPLLLDRFTIIDNDGAEPIVGTFAGLAEGATVNVAGVTLYLSYAGGDGNDVVLSSQPIVQGTPLSDTFSVAVVGTALVVTRTNATGVFTTSFAQPFPELLTIDGHDGSDSLMVDAHGQLAYDTGATLAVDGIGTLRYANLETVTITDQAARVIDDGDPGFDLLPGPAAWMLHRQGASGFSGDALTPINQTTSNVARWTFASLQPGAYRVRATFPASPAQPAAVPWHVYDDTRLVAIVAVDQREPPRDVSQFGAAWKELGEFSIAGHTLRVEFHDPGIAGRAVAVDAVWIERVEDGSNASPNVLPVATSSSDVIRIVDDGDPAFSQNAPLIADSVGRSSDSRKLLPGTGAAAASWTFTGLAAGYYQAYATWPEKLWENSAAAAFTVAGADDSATTLVDQRGAPHDLTASASAWGRLGLPIRATANGTITVTLDNRHAANFAVADAIRLERLAGPELVVLDVTGGGALFENGGSRIDFGSTTAGASPLTRVFELRNYGATPLVLGDVQLPVGFALASPLAAQLPAATNAGFSATTLVVSLSTQVPGMFRGDLILNNGDLDETAFRLTLEGFVGSNGDTSGAEIEVIDETTGAVVESSGSALELGSVPFGVGLAREFTIHNRGERVLTVGAPQLPWGFDLVTAPASVIAPGGSSTFRIAIGPERLSGDYTGDVLIPSDDSDEGGLWFRISARVASTVTLIDNGAQGFSASGGFANDTGSGYDFTGHLAPPGSSGMATWNFTGLPTGLYQVAVTWPTGPSPHPAALASNATYTLSNGGALRSLVVDQRQAPNDFSAAGVGWEEFLGTISYTAGSPLQVSLSASGANGYVWADAVRVTRLTQPEIQVRQDGVNTSSDATTLSFPTTFIGDSAPAKSLVIENTGPGVLTLPSVLAAPAGFEVIVDSHETQLATGATRALTLRLATNSEGAVPATRGAKSGLLAIPNNDRDESVYRLALSGAVETVMVVDQAKPMLYTLGHPASYVSSGGFRNVTGGYLGLSQYTTASASSVATFTVTGLPAGVYQVSATWSPKSAWATNAPFRVNGGMLLLVNQTGAPSSVVNESLAGQVASWQILGAPITIGTNGTIQVSVGGVAANRYVTADALRLEWVSPAVPLVGALRMSDANTPLGFQNAVAAAPAPAISPPSARQTNTTTVPTMEASLAVHNAVFAQLGQSLVRRAKPRVDASLRGFDRGIEALHPGLARRRH